MNLFVWKGLTDPKLLSFILRKTYDQPLEPALLNGFAPGTYYRDFLFFMLGDSTDAFIAPGLTTSDFVLFDKFFAVAEGVHKRTIQTVNVVRNGRGDQTPTHVYIAGPSFHKLRGGRFL